MNGWKIRIRCAVQVTFPALATSKKIAQHVQFHRITLLFSQYNTSSYSCIE